MMCAGRQFSCREAARKCFTPASKMHKRSQVLEILSIHNRFLVALLENGRCTVHNLRKCPAKALEVKDIFFINKSCQEYIRSIFFNRHNQSIIIVSVTAKDDCNSLKCRSVPVSALGSSEVSRTKGTKLFRDYVLRWPDFIEFDELNCKIITKHSAEEAYRVWSLATYQL